MDYLDKLLNYKKLDRREILKSHCHISLKIDGNAIQAVYHKNTGLFTFHKRPYAPNKIGQEIDIFDLSLYSVYWNAVRILNSSLDYFYQWEDNTILNFEIVDKSAKHLIKYDEDKIYFISAYLNDVNITDSIKVSLDSVPVLYDGFLPDSLIDLYLEKKDEPEDIWNASIVFLSMDKLSILEGIVLTFDCKDRQRTYKLLHPDFKEQIDNHLSEESRNKESINLEELYSFIIFYGWETKFYEGSLMLKLLTLYCHIEGKGNKNDLEKFEKKLYCLNLDALNSIEFNFKKIKELDKDLVYEAFNFDTIKYPNILKFILLAFRNKRSEKCLWCSREFQEKTVNIFIEKYLKVE